ncbi:MAG: thioredoxin-like domain-containing protein [Planctomycetota bacterium]
MQGQTKRVGWGIVLGLGLGATLGAIAASDTQRLESARSVYERDVQKAQEVYAKRLAAAEAKLLKSYKPVISRYETRNDTEAVAALRAELEETLAAHDSEDAGALAAAKPKGHEALIEAIGPKVLDATGRGHDTKGMAGKEYMLLYFSAQWCPPCRKFTPDLVKFYNQKRAADNFDLIFVSSDRSARDMTGYMKSYNMPWAAVPYNRINASGLKNKYGGSGIPNLVIVNRDGEVVSGSYENGKYVGPRKVLRDLDALLTSAR